MWLTRSETMTVLVARACASAVLAFVTALLVALVARRSPRAPARARSRVVASARRAARRTARGRLGARRVLELHPRRDATDASRPASISGGATPSSSARTSRSPGYRELLIAAHDLDTRRDVIFGLVGARLATAPLRRRRANADDHRRAEVVDLSGEGGAHVMDAIAGALSVPLLTEPHLIPFATHRVLARRDPSAVRSAGGGDSPARGGVGRRDRAGDSRDLGRRPGAARTRSARASSIRARGSPSILAGAEASAARDGLTALFDRFSGVFQMQPTHNALGCSISRGRTTSDRTAGRPSPSSSTLGYEDAYRQFIEPVVGASGDELERREAARPASSTLPPPSTPSTPSISEMLANLE